MRLLIHGGCGVNLFPGSLSAEREAECRKVLKEALLSGYGILSKEGSAVDAVVAAVRIMEDCPEFNAGRGAVLTTDGTAECDAGIMDGYNNLVGGVSTLTRVKNPIEAAVCLMRNSPHSLLCGTGADRFAESNKLSMVDPSYFLTQLRQKQLDKQREVQGASEKVVPQCDHSMGTVGAVALDSQGRLASASSTGGMSGKLPGRVSDSSIAGAGFWADRRVAVSGTGNGDNFIRTTACRHLADLVSVGKVGLKDACDTVVNGILAETSPLALNQGLASLEASAGVIAVDVDGNFCMSFNTSGMFRGYIDDKCEPFVAIFDE